MSVPLTQYLLADGRTRPESIERSAYNAGREACRKVDGHLLLREPCPYPPGSDGAAEWRRGWCGYFGRFWYTGIAILGAGFVAPYSPLNLGDAMRNRDAWAASRTAFAPGHADEPASQPVLCPLCDRPCAEFYTPLGESFNPRKYTCDNCERGDIGGVAGGPIVFTLDEAAEMRAERESQRRVADREVDSDLALPPDSPFWSEYDYAAKWCAQRGHKGEAGDPLPSLLSAEVCDEINADPDAFGEHVRATAYALAMEAATGHCPLCNDTGEVYEKSTHQRDSDLQGPFPCPRGCDGNG